MSERAFVRLLLLWLAVCIVLGPGAGVILAQEEPGESDLEQAARVNAEAIKLYEAGRYTEAEPLYERALAINEKELGPEHPDVVQSLKNLGSVYLAQDRYAEAEPLYQRVLAIQEKELGPEHPDTAQSLNGLAAAYEGQGRYVEAEPLFKRALAIREKELGPEHPDVAGSLNNLAVIYDTQGRYEEAEPLFKRSLAINEKALEPDYRQTARSLNGLAAVYAKQGRHADAEPLCRRALSIREKALGPEHPDVAQSLNSLAVLYGVQGRYAEAEPLCSRALSIRETALGPEHPDVADSLGNLALLCYFQGRYAEAEPLCSRALSIRETALGPEHPDVADSLNNLAVLYYFQGRYAEAEPLYERALAILEKALGPEHPAVAAGLNNLAVLCYFQGRYAEAEPLHRRCLAIREKALGPEHPDVAGSLSNLAVVYRAQGRYEEAEPLFKRALAIEEKALGPEHPDVAISLNDLAALYWAQARYAEAEPFFKRALAIWEKMLGPDHPYVARTLSNLARFDLQTGNAEGAWECGQRARQVFLRARGRAAAAPLARSSFQAEHAYGSMLPALALKLGKEEDPLQLLEQDRALGLRELLAEARAQTAVVLPQQIRERVMAALARINALSATIEKHASEGLPVDELRYELQRAEMDYDALMAELAEGHEAFVAAETARGITSDAAARTPVLDQTTAIVGWIELEQWRWGYVIRRGEVKWVQLPDAAQATEDTDPIRRVLSCLHGGGNEPPPREDLAGLYRQWFLPLEPHLAGVERLVVIAQGWAAMLPAEMLLTSEPTSEDMAGWPWLAERYEISYAPSVTTLDILCRQRDEREGVEWERELFALADPPFSKEQLAEMQSEAPVLASAWPWRSSTEGLDSASPLGQIIRFDPTATPRRLVGTRLEAELVGSLGGADKSILLLGPDATERALFEANASGELGRCRYVHLATHGLADADRPELSALVLARVPPDPDYDALLHMREVLHLKLNADLVVLSACQTGLGKQMSGEGIVGLSTAFFFAGTPSIVMSLWNVSDISTALLMRRFYGNLLAGQRKSAALREAKSWLRNLTLRDLEELTAREPLLADAARGLGEVIEAEKGERVDQRPFAHPHYWAPFILTGDPR